jgi:leucyl-tRNA synthetase
LFNSYFCNTEKKALPISKLIEKYSTKGAIPKSGAPIPGTHFTAKQWNSYSRQQQEEILMKRRLAFSAYGEVNWCEALGTVLANDEVVNGVSERGGYPVEKRKMRQWYLRITSYADRLLEGLETVDFSDSMKEMQRNWIGKSSGAEIKFKIEAPSRPSPEGKESQLTDPRYRTAQPSLYNLTKRLAEEKRNTPTTEEDLMWQLLRNNKTGLHIRRQHIIGSYIVDFACLDKLATIEIDGGYHNDPKIQQYDKERTRFLKENGFTELRFTNEEVKNDAASVVKKITEELSKLPSVPKKSEGSQVSPLGGDLEGASLTVYTTRPDTIFGVDFMVLAPEHELVEEITTADQKEEIEKYLHYVKSRSDRERQAEVKQISGCFTGSYAINPFDGREIPIWIAEYVLAGYGTGAIMAVPCGDQRDFLFAKHFNIPITNIIGEHYNGEEANPTKDAILQNSGFLNGMLMKDAIEVAINKIEKDGVGKRKVNYKMRDAGFSRQRYWGEPFPIIWSDGIALPLDAEELPLELPHVDKYGPGPSGEGPLANLTDWVNVSNGKRETSTMPGYAGSSWYFLRYMDPHNEKEFCSRKASDYWNQVDLYIGGTEHAVGHLLYSRMWTKVLFDLGLIGHDEPYKRLVNQGMIQGSSRFVYRLNETGVSSLFFEFLDSNFKKYKFVTTDFDEKRDFDYRGESNGITYFVEISNYETLLSKFKKVKPTIVENDNIVRLYISSKEFLSKKYNDDAVKWFQKLLDRRLSYFTEIRDNTMLFLSKSQTHNWDEYKYDMLHVDVNIVNGVELDMEAFVKWKPEYKEAVFICEGDQIYKPGTKGNDEWKLEKYICGVEVEKMSKSKFNTVSPYDQPVLNAKGEIIKEEDGLVIKYGADTFRMYEMFLGPVEMSKPWDTKGIEGVYRFLKKLWRLFYDEIKGKVWNEEKATEAELKVLHRTIKKIEEDTERFSFNTAVSAFMIAVNDLTDLKCHKKEILESLLILLTPYAPHIAEELWSLLDNKNSIVDAGYPKFEEKYVIESSKEYPISINGKLRTTMNISLDAAQPEIEKIVLENDIVQKWLEGKQPKKIIFVKGKMVNVVI